MKKLKFYPLKKTKASALLVSVIAFVALASRFGYVFYMGDSDLIVNFLGFKWLSIFLYNFGVEVSMIGMGSVLWISTKYHQKGSYSINLFRIIGASWIFAGSFFMSWVLASVNSYTKYIEVSISILFALSATFISCIILMIISREINQLRKLEGSFITFIIRFRNHFKTLLDTAIEKDIYDKVYQDKLKAHTKELEKTTTDAASEVYD